MQIFQGKVVSPGIAMGPVVIWKKNKFIAERGQIWNHHEELARLDAALELSKRQLNELKKESTPGDAILEAQIMLLQDDNFVGCVRNLIRTEQVTVEYAVQKVSGEIADKFATMEDEYIRERVADIGDVADCMLRSLSGQAKVVPDLRKDAVIFAEELTPGDTMQFDREKVLAFVTVRGSYHSHAAILARALGIPALVGVDLEKSEDGKFVIVDAIKGQLILNPDDETLNEYTMKMQQEQEEKSSLQAYENQETMTSDGSKIYICANVGSTAEVQKALVNGAEGIGLFRSEFLYLGRESYPTEEEQFEEYKQAVMAMGEKQVIIRTMDMGADKQAPYFNLEKEENPALGCRGIRFCLRRPDIFKVQLKALLRAAVYGNLAVMYPMITSVEEVNRIYALVEEAAKELEQQKIAYKIPPQGIMVETPAAVLISDELAKKVDFFSIGTNDLTQYTLAIDRQNNVLDEFYNPRHQSVMRMIQMVVDNAHKVGKPVGICGELAADTTLTEEFVRMGVDELSVVPGKVWELRKIVQAMEVCK